MSLKILFAIKPQGIAGLLPIKGVPSKLVYFPISSFVTTGSHSSKSLVDKSSPES